MSRAGTRLNGYVSNASKTEELEEALSTLAKFEGEYYKQSRKEEQKSLAAERGGALNPSNSTTTKQSYKTAFSSAQSDDVLAEEYLLEHMAKLARGEFISEQEENLVELLIENPASHDDESLTVEEKELLAYAAKSATDGSHFNYQKATAGSGATSNLPSSGNGEVLSAEEQELLAYAKTLNRGI
ncbi:MAG: hypothetical protein FWC13_07585 [Oscillospiraceae bacterium]|nr:hypothetical protein [Oscillospiraceae bacterium]